MATFKIQVTETGNLLHFIYNFTNCHFSVRDWYKKDWLLDTGPLNISEKKILIEIEKVFRKYSFGPSFWGKIFFIEPDRKVWKTAEKLMLRSDLEIFKKGAKIFLPRFEKIWYTEKIYLLYWQTLITKKQEQVLPMELIKELACFFNFKMKFKQLRIVLLIAAEGSCGGGANFDDQTISLEIGRGSLSTFQRVILTVWHEFTHLISRNDYYQNLVTKTVDEISLSPGVIEFKNSETSGEASLNESSLYKVALGLNGIPLEVMLNEAVVGSLFPQGYFAQKYFNYPLTDYFDKEQANNTSKQKSMKNWIDYVSYNLLPLNKRYVEKGQKIDQKYMIVLKDLLINYLHS